MMGWGMETISLGGLKAAVLTGGMRTVGVVAAGGLFFVTVRRRSGGWLLLAATRSGQARVFRDPGRAILLLHGLGVRRIVVDVARWEPWRAGAEGARRPDVAARLRRAHGVVRGKG